MKTRINRYLAPLVLVWTSYAYAQTAPVAPALESVAPSPVIGMDRPAGQEKCYPRGTLDALGRVPTDMPLCDDHFNLFGSPYAPARNTPRTVPETIDRQPESGRSTLPR